MTTLELPDELATQLQQMAQRQGISEIELIDYLLRQTALETLIRYQGRFKEVSFVREELYD